jgi:histidine kinase-like protein
VGVLRRRPAGQRHRGPLRRPPAQGPEPRAGSGQPALARAYLDSENLEAARLLVSELVTNSILHAALTHESDWIRVEAVVLPGCVRIEVSDSSPGIEPGPACLPPPGDVNGRGLWLVERLAQRWGADPPGASRIWFELVPTPATFAPVAGR